MKTNQELCSAYASAPKELKDTLMVFLVRSRSLGIDFVLRKSVGSAGKVEQISFMARLLFLSIHPECELDLPTVIIPEEGSDLYSDAERLLARCLDHEEYLRTKGFLLPVIKPSLLKRVWQGMSLK